MNVIWHYDPFIKDVMLFVKMQQGFCHDFRVLRLS